MSDKNIIDQHVKMTLKTMKKPLSPGDQVFEFDLYDDEGRPFNSASDYLAGRPLLLVFAPAEPDAASESELRAFCGLEEKLQTMGANRVLLSLEQDNEKLRAFKRRIQWPGAAISDPTGRVFAQYGLVKDEDMPGAVGLRTVVISPQRRISGIFDSPFLSDHANRCVETIIRTSACEESFVADHAPVLIIPHVFSKQECVKLIDYYERESHIVDFDRNNPAMKECDTKAPIWDHNRQDRIDLVIKHPVTVQTVNQRIFQRVTPLIKKAFGYEANQRESINIARYEGPRSGIAMGHRDNVIAEAAHRRFALSVALNDDFEGGEIVFREFSNHGYRAAVGAALVFSSSLLHEILETKSGRRYALISHLYSDTAQK